MKAPFAFAPLFLAALLAGCATPPQSGSVYHASQTQNEQVVRMGTVESVRNVTIANPESGVGTMGGAALGGLAGSQIGHGDGSAAMGIVGAIAGGLIGNRVEANANNRPGFEITVKLDSGELRAVTQVADELFRPG
ncbi:glycine zipper 2TM domain-containing protein [Massilia sp. Dwa41.01b]|uniref:glycine zipper 2TM domain-containing protein n=1 Tax=unclassified Massilia TaxID=2609279 RepID=UPI0016035EBF|nr:MULTISPECIES: glycine zipper 2TM domain-containing protein [unclassified Massilia]QNA90514.1 glycine zipper 2TM domain-containing protein [Massilia sp. Dwa41.01b]QNA97745.1 glycine zipper 2TM domain-containing protein [Massilia sp. Se16.2.3]